MKESASELFIKQLRIILLILNTRKKNSTVCAVSSISREIWWCTRFVLVRIMVIACYRISCWKCGNNALLWRCNEGQHTPTLLQHYGRDFPAAQAGCRPDELHVSGTQTAWNTLKAWLSKHQGHDQCLVQVKYKLQTHQWNLHFKWIVMLIVYPGNGRFIIMIVYIYIDHMPFQSVCPRK